MAYCGPMTSRAQAKQDHARLLRTGGLSYAQIAAAFDPTGPPQNPGRLYANASAARNAVITARLRHGGEIEPQSVSAAERRALSDDRYERLIQTWMPKALSGDAEAAQIVERAMLGQATLHGLNLRPPAALIDAAPGNDPADDIARKRAERQAALRSEGS